MNQQPNAYANTKDEIVLWEKIDKNGNPYYSAKISIDGKNYNARVFKNDRKISEKQPDFKGLIDSHREPGITQPVRPRSESLQPSPEPSFDDIPF